MAEFYFKSNGKFNVKVEGGYLSWTSKGFMNFVNRGSKGEKSIPIKSITAIQIKNPRFTTGYIQFAYSGASESKGGTFDAVKDENTITFNSKDDLAQAQELKQLIESLQGEGNQPAAQTSDADEILKYKQLLDDGILSREEYDAKKKQILGI